MRVSSAWESSEASAAKCTVQRAQDVEEFTLSLLAPGEIEADDDVLFAPVPHHSLAAFYGRRGALVGASIQIYQLLHRRPPAKKGGRAPRDPRGKVPAQGITMKSMSRPWHRRYTERQNVAS